MRGEPGVKTWAAGPSLGHPGCPRAMLGTERADGQPGGPGRGLLGKWCIRCPCPRTHALLEDVRTVRVCTPAGLLEQVRHEPPRRPFVSPPSSQRPCFLVPSSRGEDCTQAGESQGTEPSRRRRQGGLLGSQGCRSRWCPGWPLSPGPGQTPSHLGGGGAVKAACAQVRPKQQQKQLSQKQQPHPQPCEVQRARCGALLQTPSAAERRRLCVGRVPWGSASWSECRRKGRHCGARMVSFGDRRAENGLHSPGGRSGAAALRPSDHALPGPTCTHNKRKL